MLIHPCSRYSPPPVFEASQILSPWAYSRRITAEHLHFHNILGGDPLIGERAVGEKVESSEDKRSGIVKDADVGRSEMEKGRKEKKKGRERDGTGYKMGREKAG